jgi:gluconate:H+ symporter, GntP family
MASIPLLTLLVVVGFIVVATTRWRLHPFLALLIGACVYGLSNGVSPDATLAAMTGGFGRTVSAIGIVIAGGCVIGVVLERTGGALVMANAALRVIGAGRAVLAMAVTGAVVSVPVFCDSGYVVLSPLARSLARRTGQAMAAFAVALSMGLYVTHCLVPPTPGPVAAAAELRADFGRVIGLGLLVAIPVVLMTCWYAVWAGRRWPTAGVKELAGGAEAGLAPEAVPTAGLWLAFAPIVLPVGLIAARSIAGASAGAWLKLLGDPNIALLLGALLALTLARRHGAEALAEWSGEALRTAGSIVLITAAGGALGAVLRVTPLADQIGQLLAMGDFGRLNLLLPFLVAAGLKTAQGSSTVAIVTTASLVAPLLTVLGLTSPTELALTTLAIGAGAMTVSHVNDSYFWVVTQLSGFSVTQGYRLITVASGLAGFTAIATVLLLRWLIA